jgi:lipopolysaccharide/colanic/teichoic acid biosynthesis glycosyltransferase
MYKKFFKRQLDFIFAMVGILVLFPIFIVAFVALYFSNKGQPFFYQERPGRYGNVFKIIKFKTMTDQKDVNGNLLPDNLRITTFGKLVRKTSVDEIPQLINVLRGDMSLVGPRPLRVYYLPLYSQEQNRRHQVRPGITGWAQVNGRNTLSWTQKFQFDVWYVDNLSILLDVKIIFLTVLKIFKTNEVNATEDITMIPFDGKN